MTAWTSDCVALPRVLPIATAVRSIGATSSSFMKPNSRSHTIDIPPKIALNSTDMLITPG